MERSIQHELLAWVDDLDSDGKDKEEDRLVELYASNRLTRSKDKFRLVMMLLNERVVQFLDRNDMFGLVQCDDFVGEKIMSYQMFEKRQETRKPIDSAKTTSSSRTAVSESQLR